MAKGQKWNLGTAMKALHDPAKKAERQQIARRYPLVATATIEEIWDAIEQLDFVTCRKLEAVLSGKKAGDNEADETEEDEEGAAD